MPKDYYKKSTQFPKGTYNTGIPTADHTPSAVKSVKNALTDEGTEFPKMNTKGSDHQGKTGCFGKEA